MILRPDSNEHATMLAPRKKQLDGITAELPHPTESWFVPLLAAERESAIETALYAIAIGESFGLQFELKTEASAASKVDSLQQVPDGKSFPRRHGFQTVAAISVAQAILCSRSSHERYGEVLSTKLIGHRFASTFSRLLSPSRRIKPHYSAGRLWAEDRMLPAVVLLTTCLQGTVNRISPWLQSTFAANKQNEVELVDFVRLLARATQFALLTDFRNWNPLEACDWLAEGTREPAVAESLSVMKRGLEENWGLAQLAGVLSEAFEGYAGGSDPRAVVCLSIYAWLIYTHDWYAGMMDIARQGQGAASQCAIFSGLVSLLVGSECFPDAVIQRHRWSPVGVEWLDHLVLRLLQWPHGANDLVSARGAPRSVSGLLGFHSSLTMRSMARSFG